MSKGINYNPRKIKCCATCKYLIYPEEPNKATSGDHVIAEYGTFTQLLGAYQCPKSGRWWCTADNEPPHDRCSMHKFKDKSLIR